MSRISNAYIWFNDLYSEANDHMYIRAGREDGADGGRLLWKNAVRAAAAGCRSQQGSH
jgi:hypothetical protein